MPDHVRRRCSRLGLAATGLFVVALAGPAWAEDGFHPLDSALKFMNLKTDTGTMPDFVEQSRPSQKTSDYVPVGRTPPNRELKVKTPAEVKAATAELDAARAAQLAGKRPKPPGSGTPAKAAPAKTPAAKVGRRQAATDR